MPKSSRKSWTQSPSQTNAANPDGRPAGSASYQAEKRPQVTTEPPPERAPEKKPIEIKFRKGMTLQMPQRFLGCILVAFALYWHAAFTANDWLYLLCTGFLAASLSSLILPFLQLSEIEVDGVMPPEVTVSESTEILIQMRRNRRLGFLSALLPMKSIRLAIALLKYSSIRQTKEKVTPPEVACIDSISSDLTLRYSTPALKRGLYELEGVELSSGFPFGLAWWQRIMNVTKDKKGSSLRLTVFPKTFVVPGYFLFKLQGLTARVGLMITMSSILNKSTIIRGVREYQSGDSPRHIHWPASAHLGKLLVREFDSEVLPAFSLFLDLCAHWKTEEQFELAVLTIQSLTHLGHKLGTVPELMLNPPLTSKSLEGLVADLPQIPPGVELISEILARVEPMVSSKSDADTEVLKKMISQSFTDRPMLNVSPVNDSLVKYSPERGDEYFFPVELQLIRGITDTEQELLPRAASKGRTAIRPKENDRPESAHWALQTNHLATITEAPELETL